MFETEVLGVGSGRVMTISPGTFKFDVEFRLPFNIPYSTSGKYGNIAYKIEAKLLRLHQPDEIVANPFSVVQKVDLSLYTEFLRPIQEGYRLKDDLITMSVSLPKSGFAVNETLPLMISLINKTPNRILSIKYSIYRYNLFKFTRVNE